MQTALATLAQMAGGRVPGSARISPEPWWWQPLPPPAPPEPPPPRADVVIIGAGFTGLCAALTLVRAGRSVVVLERGRLGAGASTRNGGQLGSGNQKFRVATLIAMMGQARATALLREGVAMLDHLEDLITTERIACHFTRCGRFRGALRPAHYDAMARDMEDLHRHAGVVSHMVPRAEQHREIATDRFCGGSVLPDDASLHPGLYHQGLIDRLRAAGALLLGQSPARALHSGPDGHEIDTPAGRIAAREVIVATNGYTRGLDRHLSARIVQVGSAVIATAPLPPERIAALMPGGRMYGTSARVFHYFRAAPDAPRLVWGGRVGRLVRPDTPAAYGHLAAEMLRVFPDLGAVQVSHGWTGQIGYTFDGFPHLGRTPRGIHYAMGYCGTGVTRASWFGRKIALQLLGNPEGRSAFDDLAFPSHPFHALATPAVPLVEGWKRLRDRID